mmetsp:Transcript_68496/g.216804  ORF Transcript_68496/g.216804 Transcript_68496/m.216804 type:complete len:201 (+) Transcript_68496:820-1422(+)
MKDVRAAGIFTTHDFSKESTSYRLEFDPAGFIRAAAKNCPGCFLQLGWSTSEHCITEVPAPPPDPTVLTEKEREALAKGRAAPSGRRLLLSAGAGGRQLLKKKGARGPAGPPEYTMRMAQEMKSLLDLVQWEGGVSLKMKACLLAHSHPFVHHYTRLKEQANTTFLLYGPVSQSVARWVRDNFDAQRSFLNVTTVDFLPI